VTAAADDEGPSFGAAFSHGTKDLDRNYSSTGLARSFPEELGEPERDSCAKLTVRPSGRPGGLFHARADVIGAGRRAGMTTRNRARGTWLNPCRLCPATSRAHTLPHQPPGAGLLLTARRSAPRRASSFATAAAYSGRTMLLPKTSCRSRAACSPQRSPGAGLL
jgi:hypothetical protein